MKHLIKITGVILFTIIAFTVNAQVNASATASATILAGITITKSQDMNFGRLNPGIGGGSVLLSTAGVVTPSGDVTKLAGITPTAATFSVAGENNYTFSITLPTSNYIINDGSGHEMTVSLFTSDPTPTGTIAPGGTSLKVGATLTITAGQVSGLYTNGTGFNVTVNYN